MHTATGYISIPYKKNPTQRTLNLKDLPTISFLRNAMAESKLFFCCSIEGLLPSFDPRSLLLHSPFSPHSLSIKHILPLCTTRLGFLMVFVFGMSSWMELLTCWSLPDSFQWEPPVMIRLWRLRGRGGKPWRLGTRGGELISVEPCRTLRKWIHQYDELSSISGM